LANSTTLQTLARRIGVELGLMFLVENAFITALAAASFTAPKFFANTRYGTDHFASQNYWITRMGAASAADYERPAGAITVATGVMANAGLVWADTTLGTEDIELWRKVRRTIDVFNAINTALTSDQLMYSTFVPLSDLSGGSNDGDMAASGTTAYTAVSASTLSKETTAARVPYGIQALRSLSTSSDDGVQTASVLLRQDKSIRYGTIVSADVDSVTLNAYDVTGSANFSSLSSIAVAEEEPQLVWTPWGTAPTSCETVAIRGIGSSSTADIYYNMFWLYRMGNRRIELPAYVTEGYEVPSVFQLRPLQSGGTSNVWDALSCETVPLQEGVDYRLLFNQRDANPSAIWLLHDGCLDYPLMTQARQRWPALSTEASTTLCPVKEIVAAAKIQLLDDVGMANWPMGTADWGMRRSKSIEQFKQATQSRKFVPVAGPRPYYSPRRLG
jgi:hypothetical protein